MFGLWRNCDSHYKCVTLSQPTPEEKRSVVIKVMKCYKKPFQAIKINWYSINSIWCRVLSILWRGKKLGLLKAKCFCHCTPSCLFSLLKTSGWIPVGESHQSLSEQNPLGKQKPKDLPDDKQLQGKSLKSLAPCGIKGVIRWEQYHMEFAVMNT